MDCKFCNVRPAVAYHIPTEVGPADLCDRCLRTVKRKRVVSNNGQARPGRKRKAKWPKYLPGQRCFAFMQEAATGGPDETTRNLEPSN